jgi:hypothetical protein
VSEDAIILQPSPPDRCGTPRPTRIQSNHALDRRIGSFPRQNLHSTTSCFPKDAALSLYLVVINLRSRIMSSTQNIHSIQLFLPPLTFMPSYLHSMLVKKFSCMIDPFLTRTVVDPRWPGSHPFCNQPPLRKKSRRDPSIPGVLCALPRAAALPTSRDSAAVTRCWKGRLSALRREEGPHCKGPRGLCIAAAADPIRAAGTGTGAAQ